MTWGFAMRCATKNRKAVVKPVFPAILACRFAREALRSPPPRGHRSLEKSLLTPADQCEHQERKACREQAKSPVTQAARAAGLPPPPPVRRNHQNRLRRNWRRSAQKDKGASFSPGLLGKRRLKPSRASAQEETTNRIPPTGPYAPAAPRSSSEARTGCPTGQTTRSRPHPRARSRRCGEGPGRAAPARAERPSGSESPCASCSAAHGPPARRPRASSSRRTGRCA